MKALILAAGRTFRYGFPANYKPKCLCRWQNQVMLEGNVKLFRKYRIQNIMVVVGYKADEIKEFAEKKNLDLTFLYTDKWRAKEGIISLFLGMEKMTHKNFILCLGDIVFSEEFLKNLLACKNLFCTSRAGEIRVAKINRKALGDLESVRKEILSYPSAYAKINKSWMGKMIGRHPMAVGFDTYLRKHGTVVVPGKVIEIDGFRFVKQWETG